MRGRRVGTRTGLVGTGAALVALLFAVGACGSPVATPAGQTPAVSATAAAPTAAISPGLPPTEAPGATTAASPSGSGQSAGVVEDPSLLAILPADLAGVPVVHEPEAFTDALADPAFVKNVEAAAYGVAVDGSDLASGLVAKLNAGVFSDAFFRDWRDSYNEGACAQAGGVVGNAESEIGDQTVYIGSCAGGLRTYHAWLADRGVLISAIALGDRKFGELLMAGLRP